LNSNLTPCITVNHLQPTEQQSDIYLPNFLRLKQYNIIYYITILLLQILSPDTKKKQIILKSIHSILRSESKIF